MLSDLSYFETVFAMAWFKASVTIARVLASARVMAAGLMLDVIDTKQYTVQTSKASKATKSPRLTPLVDFLVTTPSIMHNIRIFLS